MHVVGNVGGVVNGAERFAVPDRRREFGAERADSAGATIETGQAVSGVSHPDRGDGVVLTLDGGTVTADVAIVATDPETARDLTDVSSIPTDARACVTQYMALPGDTALDGTKRLVLNPTSEGPNTIAPLSAVAPEYAPKGQSLVSATYLGTPDVDDDALAARTRETLEAWYPKRGFDGMELLATDRIPFAQFDQPPGFRETLPAVDAPDGAVFLAGDYTRWSSIQGAMASGRDAADAVLDSLGRR